MVSVVRHRQTGNTGHYRGTTPRSVFLVVMETNEEEEFYMKCGY